MWVITNKEDNAIFGFSNLIEQYDSGYSKINDLGFIIKESDWGVYSVQEIPEGVVSGKYCYTSALGFYENPNWIEPEEPIEPAKYTLDEAAAIIASEVANNE